MQLRVVTDQPWDVKADVLAVPILGEPAFDGPLGELDRRAGGELAAHAAFGAVRSKRGASATRSSCRPSWARVLVSMIARGPAASSARDCSI